jgi:hypothetical protein
MWHAWERTRKCTGVLVGKPEGKRPLGRPRLRWKDGIRMDLRAIGEPRLDSVGSGYGPVAGSCECCEELSNSGATELVNTNKPVSK